MNMSPPSIPNSSAINDLILILESVKDISKTKATLKELHEVVTEYQELSAKNSIEAYEAKKAKEESVIISSKNEEDKKENSLQKEALSLEALRLSKLNAELAQKSQELNNKEILLDNLRSSILEQSKADELKVFFALEQVKLAKEESEKLQDEYQEKLTKLKAVMG